MLNANNAENGNFSQRADALRAEISELTQVFRSLVQIGSALNDGGPGSLLQAQAALKNAIADGNDHLVGRYPEILNPNEAPQEDLPNLAQF